MHLVGFILRIQHPLVCRGIPIMIIIIVQRQAEDGLCLCMLYVEMFSFSSHTTCHIKNGRLLHADVLYVKRAGGK